MPNYLFPIRCNCGECDAKADVIVCEIHVGDLIEHQPEYYAAPENSICLVCRTILQIIAGIPEGKYRDDLLKDEPFLRRISLIRQFGAQNEP